MFERRRERTSTPHLTTSGARLHATILRLFSLLNVADLATLEF